MGDEEPDDAAALTIASALMDDFARRTGLAAGSGSPIRYLWTDAFAVCNFFELFRRTGDDVFRNHALLLIEQVHTVLAKHRDDDARKGWISGLTTEAGRQHPTAGGLRIGKPRNERPPNEPLDNTLEWDRDGQYFHYLTKWMHALSQAARFSADARYLVQALELAKVAHRCFTYTPAAAPTPRMFWKMSIDLSRPLVPSMGHHDPLDALITYRELQLTARQLAPGAALPQLNDEVRDAEAMCTGRDWSTDDPLGVGGLLFDAYRLAQLNAFDASADGELLAALLICAGRGLRVFARGATIRAPANHRLAFRELGLSIGLHALARIQMLVDKQSQHFVNGAQLLRLLEDLRPFQGLRSSIETFWLDSRNRQYANWREHRDINTVMLATSLVPDGFLCLHRRGEKTATASP